VGDRWNHAFKNQITTLQSQAKNRANPNRSEVQANLALFLEAASGFYTQVRTTHTQARTQT
jgi:protein SMG7